MNLFQQLAEKVSFCYNDLFKKYCNPLIEYFSLSEVCFFKITNSGLCSYIGNNPSFVEYFASNKYYLNNPYFCHPKHFQSGLSLQKSVKSETVSHLVECGRKKFNFHNTIFLVQKYPNRVEIFGFSSKHPDLLHLMKIVHEFPLIELFIKKFKRDNTLLFSKLENNQIDLAGIIGPEFHTKPVPIMDQKQTSRKNFLKSLGINTNLFSLTPKEKRCWTYFQGDFLQDN